MRFEAMMLVRQEAQRVIRNIDTVRKEHPDFKASSYGMVGGSKHTGALRRASIDLTRALAEMRKP